MKKIILIILLLFSSYICIAQNTFIKKYTDVVSFKAGIKQPWEKIDITIVFNTNKGKDIVLYYPNEDKKTLTQVSSVIKGITSDNDSYQVINCVDEEGEEIILQLFDDDTCLRLIIAEGYYIEFHKN